MASPVQTLAMRAAFALLLASWLSTFAAPAQATQVDLVGPAGSASFGSQMAVLPNGNVVVVDVRAAGGGAAYLYSVNRTLISKVTGVAPGIGSGAQLDLVKIVVLKNGNYLLVNWRWNDGSVSQVGMVAWGSQTAGISGAISAANALLGSNEGDRVGFITTVLANGNYVVGSQFWSNGAATNAGAATWGNGSTGISGRVSAVNSLVGSHAFDRIGQFNLALTNGNFVSVSNVWSTDTVREVGSITWVNGTTGLTGPVSPANSMIGSSTGDGIFYAAYALTNGNYAVAFPYWNQARGAVVWGNGQSGGAGVISSATALVGAQPDNYVGYSGITPLANGHYVVASGYWEAPGQTDVGAVTWANGNTGRVGFVSAANSLVGDFDHEYVGEEPVYRSIGVLALTNGNYAVFTSRWGSNGKTDLGAITWGNGATGLTGIVSASNSLVGGTTGDLVGVAGGGFNGVALANGHFVAATSMWHDPEGNSIGATTWVDGTKPTVGVVSAGNSLRGAGDVVALANGHYVVSTAAGVAWADGTRGRSGVLTADNSLVGEGFAFALGDGNYVVCSTRRSNGSVAEAGSATWANGADGAIGQATAANSLFGSTASDRLCQGSGADSAVPPSDGRYLIDTGLWDNGSIIDAGALTLGVGPMSGPLSTANSVLGTLPFGGSSATGEPWVAYGYDLPRGQAVVAQPIANRITFISSTHDTGPALSISDASISEGNAGGSVITFTVQLSTASTTPVQFDIGTADASATADDYVARQQRGQVIAAGVTSQTFTVTVNGDALLEADERFTVNVSNVVGAKVVDAQAIGVIRNDDGAALSIDDVSLPEGDHGTTLMTFTARLQSPLATAVSFDIATGNGSAIAGQDYVAKRVDGLTIPAGSIAATFSVVINGDTAIEADETFSVVMSNVTGAPVAKGVAVGTLTNDDRAFLSVNRLATPEGNSGTHVVTFEVRLSQAVPVDVTYTMVAAGATATAGSDFEARSVAGETIPAGTTLRTFDVVVNGDTDAEQDEYFYVYPTNVTGPVQSPGNGVGFILNDEGVTSTPTLSMSDVTMTEGNNGIKLATFSVQLSQPSAMTVTYSIASSSGTATAGDDFGAERLDVERITPGFIGRTFSVPVYGDDTPEGNETFHVTVSNVVGATPGAVQATGTIVDDDAVMPLPTLSIANVSVTEGNIGGTLATFTASLSAPAPAGGVGFLVSTTDVASTGGASAVAGSDYSKLGPASILIAPGATSATFSVKVLGDTRREANEAFGIVVADLVGATMINRSAQGTIIDDDDAGAQLGTPTTGAGAIDTTAGAPRVAIAAVQGRGSVSPLRGNVVTVQGIVTALRRNGFFLQSADAETDADAATSEGVFVFTGTKPASAARIGNRVEVAGPVQELEVAAGSDASMTTIAASRVAVVATGRALPQAANLDAALRRPGQSGSWAERFEGMRVAMSTMRVVAPVTGKVDEARATSAADGNFYAVASGVARPFRQPEPSRQKRVAEQAPVAIARLRIESLGQTGARLVSTDVGDTVTGLTGVLAQGTTTYSVFPDPSARLQVVAGAMPRAVTAPLATDITIGQFNARRLFDAIDAPGIAEPVLSPDAYSLRLAKTANAICAYQRNPDIVGISGAENRAVLSDLADAVNSGAGNELFPRACASDPGYRAVMAPGNNGVGQLGFLIRSADVRPNVPRVTVLSSQAEGASDRFTHPDGSSEPLFEQAPLLLRVQVNAPDGGHRRLSVLAVQMLAAETAGDKTDAFHGWSSHARYAIAKRRAQVQFLAALAARRQLADRTEKLVAIGGFESVEFTDARGDLRGLSTPPAFVVKPALDKRMADRPLASSSLPYAPLGNLTEAMPAGERYSASQDGEAVALDHALVNSAMLDGQYRLRTEFARINADFGEDNAGDFAVPMRVSDHDPLVIYLSRP